MNRQIDTGASQGVAEAVAGFHYASGGKDRGGGHMQAASLGTGTWVLNLLADELVLSPRTRALLGVAQDEPFGLTDFFATLHPDDLDATSKAFALATHPRVRAIYDVTYRTIGKADGKIRWVAARGVAQFDEEGFCVRAVGTASGLLDHDSNPADGEATQGAGDPGLAAINDCIEQAILHPGARAVQAPLDGRWFEYTGQRVRLAAQAAGPMPGLDDTQPDLSDVDDGERAWKVLPELLCTLSNDGALRSINPAWTALLGWLPEELLGRAFLALCHPDDRNTAAAGLAVAVPEHAPTFESRALHKDGSARWIAWSTSKNGTCLFASGRDVTAERQATAALGRLEASLRQDQKMVAIGQLAGGIAHDFNNLLQALSGGLEMLERSHVQTETGRHLIRRANAAVERGAMLTKQLLSFSGKNHLLPQAIDLNAAVSKSSASLERHLNGIGVGWIFAPGLWPAMADPGQLHVALLNLLLNAREAMPAGGSVQVATRNWAATEPWPAGLAPGDYVCVSVTDPGAGMSEEVMLRAIEPFFTTKGPGSGSGLGLSQAYGYAVQSGGTLRLASVPGRGSTVEILLPRALPAAAGLAPATPEPLLNPTTILVVDDDQDVRELTVAALQECGYQVFEAESGTTGLERLAEADVDLLLVDFAMPGMTGAEMVRLARQRAPAIGVLFMTGYADLDALRQYAAPEDILRKPFRLATLIGHVAAVTGRQQ